MLQDRKFSKESSRNYFRIAMDALTGRVPQQYNVRYRATLLKTNINRMYALSIYIIIVQISLNIINILRPSDTKSSDINNYVLLSLITLAIGIIYNIILRFIRKGRIKNTLLQHIVTYSLLLIYATIQMTFCALNLISYGGINSFIIAILIIGLFPILPPAKSIVVTMICSCYLVMGIYITRNHSTVWNSIFLTDVWANLLIITGMVLSMSIFFYYLYRANFLKEMELQQVNSGLEETIKQRTEQLEEQTAEAQAASNAKSTFLARMSHEIRTPLNAIIGMTEIARRSRTPEKMLSSLDEIENASEHLLSLLNDILDMAKIESGRLEIINEPFKMPPTLEEVIKIISFRCNEKGLNFRYNHPESKGRWLLGDKLRLKQVLINLLGNAVKFTPIGGDITLTVTLDSEDEDSLDLTFSVSDSGIGIDPDRATQLFMPFEQANTSIAAEYGGTGLGLAISQSLIEQMGSKITVHSTPGEGSTFAFSLHFEKAKDVADEDKSSKSIEQPDFSGKRILLVEDMDINRLILIELLADTGLVIEEAKDGDVAIKMFADSDQYYYDLIFMDIQMPNVNGYQATEAIRGMGRPDAGTVPIIAMTANAYREDVQRALDAGMNGHLGKPINIDEVVQTLTEYLEHTTS